MNREKQDKIRKLLEDVEDISSKIDKLKPIGNIKEIKTSGNSAHILMPKNLNGRKALVLVLPEIE